MKCDTCTLPKQGTSIQTFPLCIHLFTNPNPKTRAFTMAALNDWPEPIVPVQSLSDAGISTVPERYIKPPAERPSFALTGAGISIPVIDLAGFADGPGRRKAVVRAVADACRDWGFFQVVNHGVSAGAVEKMRGAWREFFSLPVEGKKAYANSPATYEGYGSRVGVEEGAIMDWGDYFFLHLQPSSMKNLDKWPNQPHNLREITEEYGREVMNLCEVLLKAVSMSLGLDEDYLRAAFGGGSGISACMRVNYYPKCPQPDLTLGLSRHSDPGGITVLLADDRVKGTQVRWGDTWVTVQPIPGAFVVNVGDQIQVISNAMCKSVEHRALANSDEERFTIAFFCNPRGDLPVGPARELVGGPRSPALYQPITFDEYRMYVRKRGPSGKTQVESLKNKQLNL